jgi:hypothetical protein
VSTTSKESIAGFTSTALKYPWRSMLENAKICRKIAPPIQLKPVQWKTMRILRLNVVLDVISVLATIRFFEAYTL